MVNKGTYLKAGDFLTVGDYLQSNNKLFFAIMQQDGTLAIYRGSGPDQGAYNKYGTGLWFSSASEPIGPHYVIMQQDGTLGIYRGRDPNNRSDSVWFSTQSYPIGNYITYLHNNGQLGIYLDRDPLSSDIENDSTGVVWYTQPADPIDQFDIKDVEYDITQATVSNAIIKSIGTASINNPTDSIQESEVTLTKTLEESSQWSSTASVKITVAEKVSIGIPEFCEAAIDISFEAGLSFTYGEVVTRSQSISHNVKLSAPPQTELVAIVEIKDSIITVPCKFKGNAILKSGACIYTEIAGKYVGTSAYHLRETRKSIKLDNSQHDVTFKEIKIKA